MSRKLSALLLSAAIAVSGVSLTPAPARAGDDTTRILAGIAALALLGAAIRSSREGTVRVTTMSSPPVPPAPPVPPRPSRPHRPPADRFVLPQYCLLPTPRHAGNDTLVGEKCLRRHYGRTASLPGQCRVTFWNGRQWRSGYDPTCLRGRGYVIRR